MRALCLLVCAGCLTLTGAPGAVAADDVTVMTRNLFNGAEFKPLLEAEDLTTFVRRADRVHTQLDATDFGQRARGLADEIQARKPDLIGLQEAALWRTGPTADLAAGQHCRAQAVYQDFVRILLDEVNEGETKYELVTVTEEYDIEAPANLDGDDRTGWMGSEVTFQMTLREAILKRRGVQTQDVQVAHYSPANTLRLKAGPLSWLRLRGWTSTKARVGDGPWFTFVNTHLEAFDDRTQVPSIRARQAKEFADAMATVTGPLIAVGDFNSNSSGYRKGDEQAYEALRRNGFVDIGAKKPMSCCVQNSADMQHGGSVKDFDHRVDQIFTTTPKKVKKLKTWVTGRKQSYGFWHADHAGVVGKYRLK